MQQSINRRFLASAFRYPYALLAIVVFSILARSFLHKHDGDWDVTYLLSAGHLWHGQTIYHNGDGFIYPPFPSLFALPFWLLPFNLPKLVWYLVTVVCFVFMVRWSWKLAGGPPLQGRAKPHPYEEIAFIFALIPGATYASNCISHSQTDIVIGCAIIAGCVAFARGKSFLAATLYGLAAAMKGPALIWFPYLIARRKPLAAGWLLVVFAGANLLPNLVSQQKSILFNDWAHDYLLPKKTTANVYPDVWFTESNQSLLGCVTRWTTTRWAWQKWDGNDYRQRIPLDHPLPESARKSVILGGYGLLLAVLATSLGWWPKALDRSATSIRPALEFSMVATLMLVCSPMAAKAQWGILMLPGFCLARLSITRRDPVTIFCFCAGLLAWLPSQNVLGKDRVFVGLWYGAVLWNALIWFGGCAHVLINQKPETRNPKEIPMPKPE
jgi:hypothetical protein